MVRLTLNTSTHDFRYSSFVLACQPPGMGGLELQETRSVIEETVAIEDRIGRLTKRELEVFDLVAAGRPNKIVAYELDVS